MSASSHPRSRLGALFAASFIAAAIAIAVPLAGVEGSATPDRAAAPPAAAAPASTPVAHDAPVTPVAAVDAEVTAPRNTHPAALAPYRPGEHRYVWDMTEKLVEIAPGKVVKVWTFGDQVPGPVIRVRVGDQVTVTIRNRTTTNHSIDFHAARVAPNVAFSDVAPGASKTISFTATSPGVFMYHCGTGPVVHHIANGMYGMIIVEPEGGLPAVDQEFAFVQSDFYVSDTPGQTAHDGRLMSGIPDVVAFNGYAGQYKDEPIRVRTDETVRAFVLAAGPNTGSAFHVVGTIFDRAWIDGIHPENLAIGNQTLNLSTSQGAVAEFRLDDEGIYPFVTHDFTNATKGAVGLFATTHADVSHAGGH